MKGFLFYFSFLLIFVELHIFLVYGSLSMYRNKVPDQPEEVISWETASPMGHNNIPLTYPLKYEELSCAPISLMGYFVTFRDNKISKLLIILINLLS